MSICTKCNTEQYDNFIIKKNGKKDSWCKNCHKEATTAYKKTKSGVVGEIYNAQKFNSVKRGHSKPSYTKEELKQYLYANKEFHRLYDLWVSSNYDIHEKPSIDREDEYIGYTLSNISVITWGENKRKNHVNIINGVSKGGERCKEVVQFSKNMVEIKRYVSASEASRQCKLSQGHISACCRRERKTHGQYIWRFASEA